jgi:hypothetical protein
MHWLLQTLIALDQLINAALCGGWADETMSSYAWRMEQAGKPWGFMRRVIDALARPFQQDHCRKAYESERLRLQAPPEER